MGVGHYLLVVSYRPARVGRRSFVVKDTIKPLVQIAPSDNFVLHRPYRSIAVRRRNVR